MALQVAVDLGGQHEERLHVQAVLHDLHSVLQVRPHLLPVDVVRARQLAPLLPPGQHCPHFCEGGEVGVRGGVAEGVDDHPLADEQVAADGHGSGEEDIGDHADEGAIAHSIAHMRLQKSYVVFVVGPLPEVVEGGVEEAVHDGHHPGEVDLVEESDHYEQQVNGRVVHHFEDKRLDLVTNVGDGVDLLADVQLGHAFLVLLGLPDDDFHGLAGDIHVVEDQVAVGEDEGEAHDQPAQVEKAQVFQQDGQEGSYEPRLQQGTAEHPLQFDALRQYFARLGVGVEQHSGDPGRRQRIREPDEKMSNKSIYIFHYQQSGYNTNQNRSLQPAQIHKPLPTPTPNLMPTHQEGCLWLGYYIWVDYNFICWLMSEREERSGNLTETFNPRYRKGDFKFLQLNKRNNSTPAELRGYKSTLGHEIISSFNQIHTQIGSLQEFFRTRMDIHEEQILNIAHLQIKKIQMQSESVIQKYSKLIEERNVSKELLALKYEIKYYQERAAEMYEENGILKEEIKRLKSQILLLKIGEESDHIAMRNISKKYLKEKTIRKKLELSGLHRDPKQLQAANQRMLFYTGVVNPEKKEETEKSLGLSHKDCKTPLKNDFKIKLQKLHKNTRMRLFTEPTRVELKNREL